MDNCRHSQPRTRCRLRWRAGSLVAPASRRRTEMSDRPTHRRIHRVGAQVRRRRLLALLLATPFLPASWRAAMAQGAAGEGTAAAAGKFMTLSTFATGRTKLDPETGAALLAALRESDATFAAKVDDLAADAASGKYSDVEGLEAAVRGTPKHAALLALVSALVHRVGLDQRKGAIHHAPGSAPVSTDCRRQPHPWQLRGSDQLVGRSDGALTRPTH